MPKSFGILLIFLTASNREFAEAVIRRRERKEESGSDRQTTLDAAFSGKCTYQKFYGRKGRFEKLL
jgi:hypothetical protein